MGNTTQTDAEKAKEQEAKEKAAADAKAAPEVKKVKLRYLGTSNVLQDGQTGLTFERDGEPQTVSPDVAERLSALPYEQFEKVS